MTLVNKTFSQLITFTRASSATFVGSNGLIQSATTNTPRFDYDPVTLAAKGLLIEEQRTNLLTWSQDFDNAAWTKGANITVTANAVAAPDGSTTADLVVSSANADSSLNQVFQQATVGSSATYTASLWVRAAGANQDIVIRQTANAVLVANTTVSVTSTWQRITVTFTAATNPGFAIRPDGVSNLNVYIWGAQLEQGAFSTSYIPTVASQVTRSADVASVNTLSPWYNQSAGSIYIEGDTIGYKLNQMLVSLTDNTLTNPIQIYNDVSGQIQANVWIGGTVLVPYAQNSVYKYALGVETNNVAASINGASVVSDLSVGPPVTYDRLNIGNRNGSLVLSGHIRRITYYKRRLSNADLQSITL